MGSCGVGGYGLSGGGGDFQAAMRPLRPRFFPR